MKKINKVSKIILWIVFTPAFIAVSFFGLALVAWVIDDILSGLFGAWPEVNIRVFIITMIILSFIAITIGVYAFSQYWLEKEENYKKWH